ncbi:MAG: thioredoxin domain-containing protein [Myxococcales bacterium]|nr:thioredoxin domain-containing protein [Myxococcales bacterium]
MLAILAVLAAPSAPLSAPLPIASVEDFDELTRSAPPPLPVDFGAAWCGPCRMVAPELQKLAEASRGSLIAAKVDTEALPALAARYGIHSIPTLMLFRDGAMVQQVAGAMGAAQIEAHFGLAA